MNFIFLKFMKDKVSRFGKYARSGSKYEAEVTTGSTTSILRPYPNADIGVTPHEIIVRVDNIPHLILRRSEVVGVQGYIKNVGPIEPIYYIEISTRSGTVVCDYANRGLWKRVLVGFAAAKIFDERLGEKP